MSEPIKTTYRDVEITYLEDPNRWRFTANGRERSAESLVKARESIDRALDVEKKEKPWEPFEAYLGENYDATTFEKVKVTSIADAPGWRNESQVWVSKGGKKGKRSKEYQSRLFKVTPENEALMAELQRLNAEREALDDRMRDVRARLVKIELPSPQ